MAATPTATTTHRRNPISTFSSAEGTISVTCNGAFLGHYWTDSFAKVFTDAKAACVTSGSVISNGTAFFQSGVLPPVNALSSLPSCTSANEGLHVVATNCTAGCSVGGTCTAGGTFHCELYCNSTPAYAETGR